MSADITLLKERTELRGDGKPFGGEEIRIVEEFPTLSSDRCRGTHQKQP